MNTISVDRSSMMRLIKTQVESTDAIDKALGTMPGAVDGGIASAMIGFLVAAGVEASGVVADTYRALAAITTDILDDVSASEEETSAALKKLTHSIEAP